MPKKIWICNQTKEFNGGGICFTQGKEYTSTSNSLERLQFMDDSNEPHVIMEGWLPFFDLKE